MNPFVFGLVLLCLTGCTHGPTTYQATRELPVLECYWVDVAPGLICRTKPPLRNICYVIYGCQHWT